MNNDDLARSIAERHRHLLTPREILTPVMVPFEPKQLAGAQVSTVEMSIRNRMRALHLVFTEGEALMVLVRSLKLRGYENILQQVQGGEIPGSAFSDRLRADARHLLSFGSLHPGDKVELTIINYSGSPWTFRPWLIAMVPNE